MIVKNMNEAGLTRRQLLISALAAAVAPVGTLMAGLAKKQPQQKRSCICRTWRTNKPIPTSLLTCVGNSDGDLTITKVRVGKSKWYKCKYYRTVIVSCEFNT